MNVMRPTKTHMKPKKHGWGFKTPKVEDIKEILSDAANDGENPSSMQKLLPPFSAAEERRLAEKLTGRDPNPLSLLERKFIAAALGVVAEQKDMFKSISNTDELTGVLNRRGSEEVIEREFARRETGRPHRTFGCRPGRAQRPQGSGRASVSGSSGSV